MFFEPAPSHSEWITKRRVECEDPPRLRLVYEGRIKVRDRRRRQRVVFSNPCWIPSRPGDSFVFVNYISFGNSFVHWFI